MPLVYGDGTLTEHLACRRDGVVFDVSHLGTVRVTGPGGLGALQGALTNDLERIQPGRAQYTHLLDEDGSVLDDLIVWWVGAERFDVMPNASNTSRVRAALAGAHVADVTGERAVLAVQGPGARSRLEAVVPDAAAVARNAVAELRWGRGPGAVPLVVAGTGYTGEDGVELAVPVDAARALWDALLGAGLAPAGLAARDTLRLEAGLPLHGHELGPGITPLQANLGWVVAWGKGDFPGRAALEAERERGVARRLRGLVTAGRRPPRAGQAVLVDGVAVGEVTSGNFSPVLERGIALAFLPPDVPDGAAVAIDVRGTAEPATVVRPPFVELRRA
jgi:aminomethyltransferase